MQIFLPYPNDLVKSAMSLCDIRLSKQVVEICQLMMIRVNKRNFKHCPNQGHETHPIYKYYLEENDYWDFLLRYGLALCEEYEYRFNKFHMSYFTLKGFDEEIIQLVPPKYIFPAYIKGQRNKDQIITTENVDELYQKLLCDKWDNDKVAPKWTNRDTPEFYHKEY